MKKILTLLFLLLIPQPEQRAEAQETYSLSLGAGGVVALDRVRVWHNVTTCKAASQPANCTSLPDIDNGAGGTIPNPNKLYADSTAGRSALLRDYMAQLILPAGDSRYIAARKWLRWDAATQAERDAYCAMNELPAGCDPFAR